MWIIKTWENGQYKPWTSSANPSNVNKLELLHKLVKPGVPYVIDKA